MSDTKPQSYTITPIGVIHADEKTMTYSIEIYKTYRPALQELDKFTHAHFFFWAHLNDTPNRRQILQSEELPEFYGKDVPTPMGVFANRSEYRPNPILLSTCPIISVDKANGIIQIPWIDALDGSPLIDIKPYLLMADRIEKADYPTYLQHWPRSVEEAIVWWEQKIATNE
jgi:tRNA-Thr(GGU) m(6)t(6)A37 methyltransferase TsaA